MKVFAYKIYENGGANIQDLLIHIKTLGVDERWREVNGIRMRLEAVQEGKSSWSLDFAIMRYDGPGKIDEDRPIEDFNLSGDEGFGEETAVYIDKNTKFSTVQYNHYGPKARSIQGYLSQFAKELTVKNSADIDDCQIVFATVLRNDALERFKHKTVIKKLEFTIHMPEPVGDPRRQALHSYLNTPIISGATSVHMEISAGRHEEYALSVGTVKKFIKDILGSGEDIKKLSVKAKDGDGECTEEIDFVNERLEKNYNLTPDPVSRRYDRASRWDSVHDSYSFWSTKGELC